MLVLIAATAASYLLASNHLVNADLRGIWTAGQMWSMGRVDAIYPPSGPVFRIQPPEGWLEWLAETDGFEGWTFPFLYPPIWAAVTSWISGPDFEVFASYVLVMNCLLLSGCIGLGIRIMSACTSASAGGMPPVAQACFAFLILVGSKAGLVALAEGQPHILVAFLMLVAVERSTLGRTKAACLCAGAALALAASIKIFPAGFVLIFMARRNWAAVIGFVGTGLTVVFVSIAVVGWPLHKAFLETVSQVSHTLLVNNALVSFDVIFSQVFLDPSETFEMVPLLTINGPAHVDETGRTLGWLVAPRGEIARAAISLLFLAIIIGAAWAAHRCDRRALRQSIWPLALTLSALAAPTGWVYYLIPAIVLAPGLSRALGPRMGGGLFFAGAGLLMLEPLGALDWVTIILLPYAFAEVAGALLWCVGFLRCARRAEV